MLLIFPAIRQVGPRFPYPSLALAAYLMDKGREVRMLDANVEDLSAVDPLDYRVVGLSTITGPQVAGALEAAAFVRARSPETLIVWGGIHPSITPHQTIRHPLVDVVARAEGERTLLRIVEALDVGGPLREVPGLTLLEEGRVVDAPDVEFMDINELPLLPYELLKKDRYIHFTGKPARVYLESSRGCPHDCGFCYNLAVQKKTWRAKTAERTVDEMQHVVESLGPDEIWFLDDNMSTSRKRMAGIARLLIERDVTVGWTTGSRFDYALKYDTEYLGLLKESGCFAMGFGGESGSQRVLDRVCKGTSPEMMKAAARMYHEAGISLNSNFMLGFPGETDPDIEATLGIVDELKSLGGRDFIAGITVYTPFPGTPMYADALAAGFEEPDSLEGWGTYQYNSVRNLPWLKGKRRRLEETVTLMARFGFQFESYQGPGVLEGRRFMTLVHRFLCASARFRWRHKIFALPLEWMLVGYLLEKLGFGEH
ncbi:MAG: radical SAM protein [Actinomycetota bacterium]